MLGLSSHAWKVNFCKFTNETRNGIEDASAHSGLKFLAALTARVPEAAMNSPSHATEMYSSTIALPRSAFPSFRSSAFCRHRRSHPRYRQNAKSVAIMPTSSAPTPTAFAASARKIGGWSTKIVKPQQFAEYIKQRSRQLAEQSDRPGRAKG